MAKKKDSLVDVECMGIEVTIDKDRFDDIELIDMMDDVQDGDPLKVGKILKKILGSDWKRVYDELRDDRGVVPASKAMEFFGDVMEAAEAKNS